MKKKRKKKQKEIDQVLLDTIFQVEAERQQLLEIIENSIDPTGETKDQLTLSEAKYMFLLQEAKYRRISLLRY